MKLAVGENEGDWQEFSEEGEGGRLRGPMPSERLRGQGKKPPQNPSTSTVRMSGSAKDMLTGK